MTSPADGAAHSSPAKAPAASLGLPQRVRALLFDLDGVLTRTSTVHAAAWKEMFDAYLGERTERTAVVSSSANTRDILAATGLESLFDARVDAGVAAREHLAGKPAPDTFLRGAAALEVPAQEAVVFEDAVAGVEAGRAGGFALVVGVDRLGQAERLRERGADIVVSDLEELMERT